MFTYYFSVTFVAPIHRSHLGARGVNNHTQISYNLIRNGDNQFKCQFQY